jgi:hypothetical protein
MADFTASVYKAKSFLLLPFFWPLIWACTTYQTHVAEKHLRQTSQAKLLRKVLTSIAGLAGEFWFVVARKAAPGATGHQTPLPTWHQPHAEAPRQDPRSAA